MYFGVYFWDQRGFAFCTGRRRSQAEGINPESPDFLFCLLVIVSVRRVLFREYCFGREELAELCAKLGELCKNNSMSSLWQTNNRLK